MHPSTKHKPSPLCTRIDHTIGTPLGIYIYIFVYRRCCNRAAFALPLTSGLQASKPQAEGPKVKSPKFQQLAGPVEHLGHRAVDLSGGGQSFNTLARDQPVLTGSLLVGGSRDGRTRSLQSAGRGQGCQSAAARGRIQAATVFKGSSESCYCI